MHLKKNQVIFFYYILISIIFNELGLFHLNLLISNNSSNLIILLSKIHAKLDYIELGERKEMKE